MKLRCRRFGSVALVLDGDLDEFMAASLAARVGEVGRKEGGAA